MDTRTLIRKTLIQMALQRARPGTGSRWELIRRRPSMPSLPNLAAILGPIPWAVVGALAARHYMPERATQDLDIAVLEKDASEVRGRLQQAGFRYVGAAWVSPEGVSVDVLELNAPWAEPALQAAQGNRDAAGFPILPLPYLILMKFEAGRMQDLADIARMLGMAASDQVDAVREVFRRYRPEDLEDLESLLTLGRLEWMGPEGASSPSIDERVDPDDQELA